MLIRLKHTAHYDHNEPRERVTLERLYSTRALLLYLPLLPALRHPPGVTPATLDEARCIMGESFHIRYICDSVKAQLPLT